jgi:hypothetical protein
MTYKLENIPEVLDRAIRARAAAERKTPEQAILDELKKGFGIAAPPQKRRDLTGIAGARTIDDDTRAAFEQQRRIDLSDIAGTWESDPETEAILEEQNRIDPEMWK